MGTIYQYFMLGIIILLLNMGQYSIENIDLTKQKFKNSLDAAADAGSVIAYESEGQVKEVGTGFGTGLDDGMNIEIDKAKCLSNYYTVLFHNLKFENDALKQTELKQYITMKAIVSYDRLLIADKNDAWVLDKPFHIEYNGTFYDFTLSDDVRLGGSWTTLEALGIPVEEKEYLINAFVRNELTKYVNANITNKDEIQYQINIAFSQLDPSLNPIQGTTFISFVEGIPVASLNPFAPKKIFVFNIGATQLIRN